MPCPKNHVASRVEREGRQKRIRAVTSCVNCHRRKHKCNRGTPCSSCIMRGQESKCHYELSLPGKNQWGETVIKFQESNMEIAEDAIKSNTASQLGVFGFSELNRHTSLGMFKAIDATDPMSIGNVSLRIAQNRNISDWYKAAIRQLPPTAVIDKLSITFFNEINWQYNPLDRDTFDEQRKDWDALSFSQLNDGPQAITADVRFFPALLFQLLALALLYRPPDYDKSLECLKYKAGMQLDDVANDYSDTGANLASLLRKGDISKVCIQASFLRTLFLKTKGMVVESWHSLGHAIGDARDLGWHLDNTLRSSSISGNTVRDFWHIEVCRRTWLNLCLWDAHMSTLLGRPMRICLKDLQTIPPIDLPAVCNRAQIPNFARSASDIPTPLTVQLYNRNIAIFLVRAAMIQKENTKFIDFNKLRELHDEIIEFREHLPSYLWIGNPNKSFDRHKLCLWLPEARGLVETMIWFAVLALHRPHLFTASKSRAQALKAGLNILRVQGKAFLDLRTQQYQNFLHFFSTFDAAVTVAAVYTLYPLESPRYFEEALQNIGLAITEFENIVNVNPLGRAAINVLQALLGRLVKATMTPKTSPSSTRMPESTGGLDQNLTPDHALNADSFCLDQSDTAAIQDLDACEPSIQKPVRPLDYVPHQENMLQPFVFGTESMAPLLPMYDMLHYNLSTTSINNSHVELMQSGQVYESSTFKQFQGGFDSDSFWEAMNRMETE